MAELDSLGRRLIDLGHLIEDGSGEVVRKAALAVDQTVVSATPVDTGRARSNWLVGIDAPTREVLDQAHTPGAKGSTGAENTQQSIQAAAAAIAGYDALRNSAIYISNNLPYIQKLDEGHSRQAPAGFIARAAQAAIEAVRRARIIK
jgi:hypothetical protein